MRPRPHHETDRAALAPRQPDVVLGCRARVRVVPAREMEHRDVGVSLIQALGPEARLFPVVVEGAVAPEVEEVCLVVGGDSHRRIARLPRHPGEPVLDVNVGQDLPDGGIPGIGQGIAVGPGRLLELEGAAVPDAAPVGVGEPAAIDDHGGEARRVQAGQRPLGVRRIGQPHGADASIAPRLLREPDDRVVAVDRLARILRESAFRSIASARVLEDHRVAVIHEVGRDLAAAARRRVTRGALGAAGGGLVVRSALEDGGRGRAGRPVGSSGQVDVRGQPRPVAHRYHDVAQDEHDARSLCRIVRGVALDLAVPRGWPRRGRSMRAIGRVARADRRGRLRDQASGVAVPHLGWAAGGATRRVHATRFARSFWIRSRLVASVRLPSASKRVAALPIMTSGWLTACISRNTNICRR